MSDIAAEPGGVDRRSPAPMDAKDTATYSFIAGLCIAWAHALSKDFAGGHFQFALPDDALLEMTIIGILPTAHMIWRGIQRRLQKWAGESA